MTKGQATKSPKTMVSSNANATPSANPKRPAQVPKNPIAAFRGKSGGTIFRAGRYDRNRNASSAHPKTNMMQKTTNPMPIHANRFTSGNNSNNAKGAKAVGDHATPHAKPRCIAEIWRCSRIGFSASLGRARSMPRWINGIRNDTTPILNRTCINPVPKYNAAYRRPVGCWVRYDPNSATDEDRTAASRKRPKTITKAIKNAPWFSAAFRFSAGSGSIAQTSTAIAVDSPSK